MCNDKRGAQYLEYNDVTIWVIFQAFHLLSVSSVHRNRDHSLKAVPFYNFRTEYVADIPWCGT
jgi:hypothetical protein